MAGEAGEPMKRLHDLLRPLVGREPRLESPEQFAASEVAERAALREAWERPQRAKTEAHLEACGVGLEHRDFLLGRGAWPVEPCTAAQAVREFLADKRKVFLALLGTIGSGKTLAACEAFLSLKKPVESPYFGSSWRWGAPGRLVLAQELATLSAYGEGRQQFASIASAPLVVLDEVGKERVPMAAVFEDLVNARYHDRKRLIVVANMRAKDFVANYPAPALDRFRQYGDLVECLETSFRARGPA